MTTGGGCLLQKSRERIVLITWYSGVLSWVPYGLAALDFLAKHQSEIDDFSIVVKDPESVETKEGSNPSARRSNVDLP